MVSREEIVEIQLMSILRSRVGKMGLEAEEKVAWLFMMSTDSSGVEGKEASPATTFCF